MKTIITGGPLFDGHRLHDQGAVVFENGVICRICGKTPDMNDAVLIHTKGNLIMPGLVDLHSDSLERSIEKRKGVFFDIDFAILNLDRQLASWGITSFCHAVSFTDNEPGVRSPEEAQKCVRKIRAFADSSQALVKHRIHVRFELGSEISFGMIKELAAGGLVDMISIMDHTPGQGQFKSMEAYMKFYTGEYGLSCREIRERIRKKQKCTAKSWEMVDELADMARTAGIPMLSHDDDSEAKIDLIKSLGIGASEFPVSMPAAEKAYQSGLCVFMGAPNLIRNCSSNGNLKASEVLQKGFCTGLVSDYYPESLFQAPFVAAEYMQNFEQALMQVTSGPGAFLNCGSRPGCLVPGADADIIIVSRNHEWAHVTHAFVRGRSVFQIH